jgi:anti-sigma-K factor RskA
VLKVMTLPFGEKQEFEGFAVTLEPKGGSTQPTGSELLRGLTR